MTAMLRSPRARWLALAGLILLVLGAVLALRARAVEPSLPTGEVTIGDYIDVVEIRGQVRPRKSILVIAPMQAGELQILKLTPNGTSVRAGDIVLEFDGSTLRRTIQERESELRQANEELEQAKAQANITAEQDGTAVLRSSYDVDRARLGAVLDEDGILPRVETERARLDLADAEQRLVESHVKADANGSASESGFRTLEAKIGKVRADLEYARRSLEALQVRAPSDGVVSILPNYRASSPMGSAQEFRAGDRAWPGAAILELPDLSSVHVAARLDESDRGRLGEGQEATVRVDAIPDREYRAAVTDLSVLARVDFSTWPPVKQFDLLMTFEDADDRLRPGMSASARIVVGRLSEMHLVPPQAVFVVDGRAVVYRFDGRSFVETPVDVLERSKEQAAIQGPVEAGDRVALVKPETEEP